MEDPSAISDVIINYYSSLYAEPYEWCPSLDGLDFDSISRDEAEWLERPFEEEEVTNVVRGLNGDKAPGPDGFSLAFFQFCWYMVKRDVLLMLDEFVKEGIFVKNLNVSFIVLISKIPGATELKDFRPISLVGGVYKILAKVLANRLKGVLDKIISPSQIAFVKGRQILDAVLVANECIDSKLRMGGSGLLCKLDVQKAHDHVNWNFLTTPR